MKSIYILLLTVLPICLWGQANSHQSPLNPDFVKQINKEGYIHPPHKVKRNTISTKGSVILPSSYDLRDVDGVSYIPAVRNQNPYGTCWAFGAYASIESNWRLNEDAGFTDLSEGHIAKTHGYNYGIDDGGNEYITTAYLSRLAGPVYESADPYANVDGDNIIVNKATDIPAYIDNILWLGNDPELIKQFIMSHGALATSMKSDFSSDYYNSYDYTFFYNGYEAPDHGVSIVGWDDDKVITGGDKGTPQNTGAWIIRNSWGANSNDNGYFYASYEDTHLGKKCELYYGKTPVSEIDTLFDDAKLGAVTSFSGGNSSGEVAYAAVKHHANTNYFITHIGAAILTEGTTIDITLCQHFDGETFSDTIAHEGGIFCPYAGYKKIEFPAVVNQGDFYLIVKYNTPNETYPLPAESEIEDYTYPEIEEGKLWVSDDAIQWSAGGRNTEYDFDLAVKIMAKHIGEVQPYFSANKSLACLNQEITFENKTIGEADSFLWCFPEDTFVTTSKEEKITFTDNKAGYQDVTLIAYNKGISYTFIRKKIVEVVEQIYPHIAIVNAAEYYSKGNAVRLFSSGGDSYQWYAEGYLTGESGRSITFSPNEDSIWVRLEASLGDCFETDSILIRMIEVPYDNIEDALLLTYNTTVTGISNAYASVQNNEPQAEIGSCESQSTWCEEGGVQNSLWFKFIAPTSGNVGISTHGFDNQIALYDAVATGTYQDIISGTPSNYTIIAANDDYHNDDYSAEIESISSLTPNKTYWIQMDGSAGGQEGTASITVSSTSTQLTDNSADFMVINTKDEFTITSTTLKNARLTIINSTGQSVLQHNLTSGTFSTKGQQFTNGFYLINIEGQNYNHTFKAVISDNWELSIDAQ